MFKTGKMTTKNHTRVKVEPGKQELFITREFDAPRELVFKAFTDPDLVVKWFGPRQLSTRIDRFEPGNGGSWRFVQADKSGNEFSFHGVFHEETAPERRIRTFEFDGLPKKVTLLLKLPASRCCQVEEPASPSNLFFSL